MMVCSDRIVPWAAYGEHIPLLCKKCGMTGTTKNIDYIGARTLFMSCPHVTSFVPVVPEKAEERTAYYQQEVDCYTYVSTNRKRTIRGLHLEGYSFEDTKILMDAEKEVLTKEFYRLNPKLKETWE